MPSSYTLGERFETFVKELVKSGRYVSASEVMRDGLRLLEERENLREEAKLTALRRDIEDGLSSGRSEPLDMEAILAEARQQRDAGKMRASHGA
jgi:antitoxin ParD1/3/4